MNRTKNEPNRWSLYQQQYDAGFAIGQDAKKQGIMRIQFFRSIPQLAQTHFVPLCLYVDFREGCLRGYDSPDENRSERDSKNS